MIQCVPDRPQAVIMGARRRNRAEFMDKLRRGERVENEVNVKITLLPGAELPKYARPGDSGFDLVAQEDYVVEPGQTVKVRTGICVELPEGTELQVRPRSGISANTKLRVANSPGSVDNSYRGEICVLIDNIAQTEYDVVRDEETNAATGVEMAQSGAADTLDGSYVLGVFPQGTYLIRKGDRVAQAVIAPVYRASLEVVTELAESARGSAGFGSSGVTSEGVNA